MNFSDIFRGIFAVAEEYRDLGHDPYDGYDVYDVSGRFLSKIRELIQPPKIFIEIDGVYFELSPHSAPYKNIYYHVIPKDIFSDISYAVENTIRQTNTIISKGCTPDDFMDDDISKVKDLLNVRGDLELWIPLTLCNIHVEKQQTPREKQTLLKVLRYAPYANQLKKFLDDQEKKNMTLYDMLIRGV